MRITRPWVKSAPAPDGILVIAEDQASGEVGERVVQADDYCLIAVEPLYLDSIVKHTNGTVVLTLKRR